MGKKHQMGNLDASRTARDTFKEILQQPKGEFQYLRELVQNSVEAGATHIKITYEPVAWDKYRVARMMILDNGCGFSKADFKRMVDLNSSGKNTEGVHRNYGIGAKISTLGFNPHGFVVLSWQGTEAHMVRVRYDETDKAFVVSDETMYTGSTSDSVEEETRSQSGSEGVFKPCYVSELLVDFSETLEKVREAMKRVSPERDAGTAVILCGRNPFESTLRRNAKREQINGSNITGYLNRRYYELPLVRGGKSGERVDIKFVGAPLPVNTLGTSRDSMNRSFDIYEDAIHSKWSDLKLQEDFYGQIFAYQCVGDAIEQVGEAQIDEEVGEEGTLTSFPHPSELNAIQNGADLASFVKDTWLRIKKEVKQRTQRVYGLKDLLKNCPAKGTEVYSDISVDWYVVDDKTWKGYSSHDLPTPDRKASVALLYQDEAFNFETQNKAKLALTQRWAIPFFTNSTLNEEEDLRDRIKIFVRFPLLPDNNTGEGVRPNKTRTELVWETVNRAVDPISHDEEYDEIETGNMPWSKASTEFTRNMPQAILDVIAQYQPSPESLDRISVYFAEMTSSTRSTTTKTCDTCGNPYRCTCESKPRPTPSCVRCGLLKDGSCVCPSTGTRTPRKKHKPLKIRLEVCNITWVTQTDSKPKFGVDEAISITDKIIDETLVYEVNMTAYLNSFKYENLLKRFEPYFTQSDEIDILNNTIQEKMNASIQFFVWNALEQYNKNENCFDSDRDLINPSTIEARLCFDDNLEHSILEKLKCNGVTKNAAKLYKSNEDKKRKALLKSLKKQ